MQYPQISILCPTWNRNKWLPLIIHNIQNLDYDKKLLELVILDDGDDKMFKNNDELKSFIKSVNIKVQYHYQTQRLKIGEKRNKLTKLAKYKICANLDTDDIFMPSWLKHSIDIMNSDKRCSLVGTKGMLFCYPDDHYDITKIECGKKRMIHESGMLYTKKHHRMMGGFRKNSAGEGTSMIDYNENKCLCTEVKKVIVCICHDENTITKDTFRDKSIGIALTGELKTLIGSILPNIKPYVKPKIYPTHNHFFNN